MSTSQDVLARIEREQEGYLEELKDYLRIDKHHKSAAFLTCAHIDHSDLYAYYGGSIALDTSPLGGALVRVLI